MPVKIETFVKGRVELIEYTIPKDSKLIRVKPCEHVRAVPDQTACLRGGARRRRSLIPDGDYEISKGDRLHIAVSHIEMERFFRMFGKHRGKIRKVIICGGGRVSYYLATQLCKLGMQVKIIERDVKRCEELCELLPKATIINGDATDHDLLIEEGIDEADAFVGLTGMDEKNIITALFAKSQGASKIIAKINEDRRASMVEDFGIDSIVSAKTATADAILSYVRARKTPREAPMWRPSTSLWTRKSRRWSLSSNLRQPIRGSRLKNLSSSRTT